MSFSCQKGEFDRFFNRLDRPVEESRPDRQPDRPFNPTGFRSGRLVRARTQLEPESINPNPARTRKLISSPNHARENRKLS